MDNEETSKSGETTSTDEGSPFAGLFTQEATAESQPASTENANTKSAEETPSAEPTTLDSLFTAAADDDADIPWDGQSPLNQHPRFQKIVEQKRAANDRAELLQAQLDDLLASASPDPNDGTPEIINELYGDYENPVESLRADADFVRGLVALHDAGDKRVEDFMMNVMDPYLKTGKANVTPDNATTEGKPDMSTEDTTEETPSNVASLATKLAQREWKAEIGSVLTTTEITPELQGVITTAVLSKVDVNSDVSTKAVQDAALAYIKEQGWSMEFVTGGKAKTKSDAAESPPTGKPAAAAKAAAKQDEGKEETTAKDAESPEDFRESLRSQLSSLAVAAETAAPGSAS